MLARTQIEEQIMSVSVFKTNNRPHPLEPIVWQAFAENDHQDVTTIVQALAGAYVKGGHKAYCIVNKDVLGFMESQGKVKRDRSVWYRPTRAKQTEASRLA
jgi:hypothetical protein